MNRLHKFIKLFFWELAMWIGLLCDNSDKMLKFQSYSIHGAHAGCRVCFLGGTQQTSIFDRIGIGTEPLATMVNLENAQYDTPSIV